MASAAVTLLMPPPYRSEAWQAWRRHGLGASDLPAVVGCDPYKGEYALALEKRGEGEPVEETVAMRWGKVVEPLALDFHEEMLGHPIARGETFGDPRWPHLYASLDGRHERIGYEVKATTRWVLPPRHVRVQALAQMGLAGLDAVDVVRVSPYGEPLVTTIKRDEDDNEQAITDLMELGEAWYARYVLGDETPAPDGSEQASRFLSKRYADVNPEGTATADERQAELALFALQRSADREAAEVDAKRARQQLQESMVGLKRLDGEGFRATWVHRKGSTTTNWEGVAGAYLLLLRAQVEQVELPPAIEALGGARLSPEMFAAIEGIYTQTGEPSEYVTVKAVEKEEDTE